MPAQEATIQVALLEGPWSASRHLSEALDAEGLPVVLKAGSLPALLSGSIATLPTVALVDLTAQDEPETAGRLDAVVRFLAEVRERLLELRTLVMAAHNGTEAMERCIAAGASGYLLRSDLTVPGVLAATRAVAQGQRLFPLHLFHESPGVLPPASPNEQVLRSLTRREREVLAYLAGGADNLKIAACLTIAERTVKCHVTQLYRKLGSENRTQLALRAHQLGVRPPRAL